MRFINRKEDLQKLEEYYDYSKNRLFTVAIYGLRRVGKTTLVKEFIKNKKNLYFFVYDSKTSFDLLKEFTEELRTEKLISEFEQIQSWNTFFDILFKRCNNYVIIFDEFQNFFSIDKSIFSIMQRKCDDFKDAKINLIILGSIIGLFKKIFEDKKNPLYGRISAKLNLKPFVITNSIETLKILKYNDIETMLEIYGIFGGFPKYYAAIEQFGLTNQKYCKIIEYLFIQNNAPLETEVPDILKQEFGRRSSLYYAIIHSIAIGKTKLNDIATNLKMKDSSITRHLKELEDKFNLIKSIKPLDSKKNTRYALNHSLIAFWFAFVYDKFSYYSLKDTKQLMDDIKQKFDSYFGRTFENISQDYLVVLNTLNKLPFKLDYLSNWWGHKRENNLRLELEIDLVGINQKSKQIMFVECKWSDKVNAKEILTELKEKSKYVNWHNATRDEYFCIIAKSFKDKIKDKKVILIDLKDIGKKLL